MSDRVAALAEHVLKKATAAGVKLATAESCTAGRLATLLADAPGGGDTLPSPDTAEALAR